MKLFVSFFLCLLSAATICYEKGKEEVDVLFPRQCAEVSHELCSAPDYSNTQLFEIAQYTGTMRNLVNTYPTPYVKTLSMSTFENSSLNATNVYRIIYLGESKVLILTYDVSGNKMTESYHNATMKKETYASIAIGSTLSEVQALDPLGEYTFLHMGRNDVPRVSSHYTTDGYILRFTYDRSNIVITIEIETM